MATKAFTDKVRGWMQDQLTFRQHVIKTALINRWLEMTGELGSTLPAYQAAMDFRTTFSSLIFVLKGNPKLAHMVEYGMPPFDMRETLLKSTTRSIRVAKAGHLYLYVPFRITTRRIRELGGSVVERAARALAPYPTKGARLPEGLAAKLDPYHATDPLASLVRHAPKGNQRGSTYMTWRTISQRGKPWIHKGIKARHFLRRLAEEAPDIAREAGKGL